jgi:hypothetical protein
MEKRNLRTLHGPLIFFCLVLSGLHPLSADKSTPAQKAEGKAHFVEGSRAFEKKDYKVAIESFRKAYDLVRSPEIIYNIGRCYEELGQAEDALYHYEMYLRFYPTAEDAEDTRHRIAMLQEVGTRSGLPSTDAASTENGVQMEDLTSGDEPRPSKVDRKAALAAHLASRVKLSMGLGGAMGFDSGDFFQGDKFAFLPFDVAVTLGLGEKLGIFLAFDYARYAEGKTSVLQNHFPERRIGAVAGLRWLVPLGKVALDIGLGGMVSYVWFNHPDHPGFYGGRFTGGLSVPISVHWSFYTSALLALGVLHSSAVTKETEFQGEAGARIGFEYAF